MVELLQPDRGCGVAFVRKVVGFAGEPINEGDGSAQARRKQNRGDGKILVVVYRHPGSEKAQTFMGLRHEAHASCKLGSAVIRVAIILQSTSCAMCDDAKVAELVDAPDLGSGAERRVGSSPSFRTR